MKKYDHISWIDPQISVELLHDTFQIGIKVAVYAKKIMSVKIMYPSFQ